MIDSVLDLIGLTVAALILWRTEPALNRMSTTTHWMIRYALLLMAAGALALLLSILAGQTPSFPTLLLASGLALLLICERRLRYLLTHPRSTSHAQR